MQVKNSVKELARGGIKKVYDDTPINHGITILLTNGEVIYMEKFELEKIIQSLETETLIDILNNNEAVAILPIN